MPQTKHRKTGRAIRVGSAGRFGAGLRLCAAWPTRRSGADDERGGGGAR